jgi:hypothetical protein
LQDRRNFIGRVDLFTDPSRFDCLRWQVVETPIATPKWRC